MSQTPFLELVICTYNHAALLEQALGAIAQQQPPSLPWGVLVVNNNCTDHTDQVVQAAIAAGQIPHLRLVREPVQGLTPARLCGICQTTAPWVAFVDDDCHLQPDWVAQAMDFAAQHPTCGAFGGRVTLAWETPPPAYVLDCAYAFAEQEQGPEVKPVTWLVGAGMVVNRAALHTVGWTQQQFLADRIGKTLVSGGDVEIALRLATRYGLWYTPHCQLLHQIPSHRTTLTYLLRINAGLGTGQLLSDALRWSDTEGGWRWAAIQRAWTHTRYAIHLGMRALLQRHPWQSAVITIAFGRGYWAGIWQVMGMNRSHRRRLLGAIHRPLAVAGSPSISPEEITHGYQ